MNTRLLLKEKQVLLKSELGRNLKKKFALELEINKQFEQLKMIETSIEKSSHMRESSGKYAIAMLLSSETEV